MECKNCGAVQKYDAIFCTKCGTRIDGKKVCTKCHKTVEEDADFCPYCGASLSGKIRCSACGTVFEGSFCPQCGKCVNEKINAVAKSEEPIKVKEPKEKGKGFDTYKKVVSYLSPSLLLAAMTVLFICSFFVGVMGSSTVSSVTAFSGGYSTFDYFGTVFDEIKTATSTYTGINGSLMNAGLYTPAVIVAVAVAANLAVSFAMLLVSSIKLGVGFYKKQEVKIAKFAAISFFFFAMAATLALGYLALSTTYEITSTSVSTTSSAAIVFSSGSNCGVIIGAILLLSALAISIVSKGKSFWNKKVVFSTICSAALILLTIAVLCVVTNNVASYSQITNNSSSYIKYSGNYSAGVLLTTIYGGIDAYVNGQTVFVAIMYAMTVVIAVVLLLILLLFIIGLFNGKTYFKLTLTFSIISAVASIILMVFSLILVADDVIKQIASFSATGSIITMVLSVLLLAATIFYFIFNKNKQEQGQQIESSNL